MSIFADREPLPDRTNDRDTNEPPEQGQELQCLNEPNDGGVRVKTDINVHVDSDGASTSKLVD